MLRLSLNLCHYPIENGLEKNPTLHPSSEPLNPMDGKIEVN